MSEWVSSNMSKTRPRRLEDNAAPSRDQSPSHAAHNRPMQGGSRGIWQCKHLGLTSGGRKPNSSSLASLPSRARLFTSSVIHASPKQLIGNPNLLGGQSGPLSPAAAQPQEDRSRWLANFKAAAFSTLDPAHGNAHGRHAAQNRANAELPAILERDIAHERL